jgi:hypothetical protein
VDEPRVTHDEHHDHDDTLEAHYASLERQENRPCLCFGGYHYIGYEEGGEEYVEVVECKRCKQAK